MEIGNLYGTIYVVAFVSLGFGSWLFLRGLDPKGKKKWQPRLSLLSIVVIGPLLLVPPIARGQWPFALVGLAVLVFIGVSSVKLTRVCETCGHTSPPPSLVSPAPFCSKSSAQLTPSRLFGAGDA